MRKHLASALIALASVVVFNTASADTHRVKPTVDFKATARLNGSNTSLGHTGVVVKIQSASIAKDGTITARATITDSDGMALDRLGVATQGPVSLSFIAAYIPAGKSQYVSYTTTTLKATINDNPPQVQAANDSGGTFTQNAIGDYTYTFKTKAPATFDPTVTHSIGVSAFRNLAEFGTFDEWAEVSNDVFNFVPNGASVKNTRSVVSTNACNQCHDPLFAHGGSRVKVELCIICHTPQTVNPDTQLTMDMKVLIHKIHRGSSLPSVKAGTPYRVWHRGAWSDFSDVVFPQDVRNCTTCHSSDAAQADNYKTNPTAAACGSCHDDVNFATGLNHVNLPQPDDNQCKGCHISTSLHEFDASVPGAHLVPKNSNSLPGIVLSILKVDNATPGNQPVVTFRVLTKSGAPVDVSKISSIRMVLAGPNSDYNTGPGAIRASETPNKVQGDSNGIYVYTMTNKIPAAATGSYTISMEATNTVTVMPNTLQAQSAVDAAVPVEFYFSVDKSAVAARRQVVSTDKCTACHMDLGFVHGNARAKTEECVICHNPALSDGTSGQSVNFATQIHSIHRGENLTNPYVLGTTNYQDVKFPGDLRNCETCHMKGTYLVENVPAKAAVASPGGFTKTTAPISAACQGCHDDIATASHTLANTTSLGESCAACHSAGEAFSVDRVH